MNDDVQVLQLIAKGDKAAFNILYTTYSSKVYATALHYLQNIIDAEEVTQDVFLSIYKNASSFKGNSSISTWVYRITINTALNYIKLKSNKESKAYKSLSNNMPNFEHPGIIEEKKENAKLLYAAINTLVENQKTAFILGYIEDLPRQEIANIMEMSVKAVESLLQRAKANLKIKLEELNPNRRKL